jgi:hypothetical protein
MAASVKFTIGHAAALGRSPDIRRETLYTHLVNSSSAATPLTPKGQNDEETTFSFSASSKEM